MLGRKKIGMAIAGVFLIAGCVSSVKRGSVAMKVDESIAHVAMNKDEVQVGDHVELYGNSCKKNGKGEAMRCEKILKGHGQVTKIINDSYSEVTFESGAKFVEGDFIEKHSH
jgi:hypothetical protein